MRRFADAISDRKIRFALVGCGRIAANHFAAIRQHADRAELVSVCDVAPEALNAATELTGAKPHSNLASMLKGTDADAVILTTPSGLHSEQAIEISAGVARGPNRASTSPLRPTRNLVKFQPMSALPSSSAFAALRNL